MRRGIIARRAAFFARSPPALWNAEHIPLGSPDRAKGIYLCVLCVLCVSVVNHFCVSQDTPVNAYREWFR